MPWRKFEIGELLVLEKGHEMQQIIGCYLFSVLRLSLGGDFRERKYKLIGALVQFGVEYLIVDAAYYLLQYLIFLKELTNQGRLPPYHPRWGYVWSSPSVGLPCLQRYL